MGYVEERPWWPIQSPRVNDFDLLISNPIISLYLEVQTKGDHGTNVISLAKDQPFTVSEVKKYACSSWNWLRKDDVFHRLKYRCLKKVVGATACIVLQEVVEEVMWKVPGHSRRKHGLIHQCFDQGGGRLYIGQPSQGTHHKPVVSNC